MRQPQISIVVPIYNVEKFIRQCLDSIVNQTYKHLEIILIDDGSPDNCGAICDEYAAKDDRIVVIHKKNAGVSTARNDGIDRATGEWVMFVDPDDWLAVDCCEKVADLTEISNCDVIYFQRDDRNDSGTFIQSYPPRSSGFISEEELKDIQLCICKGDATSAGFDSATPWGKLYRRVFLKENKCQFPAGIKKRQDVIFNLLCLEQLKSAYYLDYIGYHYRCSEDSICRRYNSDMMNILLEFYHKAVEFVEGYHCGDVNYERMLGVLATKIHEDLRETMFFNATGYMPVKEYLYYMGIYYDDPAVKKYIKKARTSDFHRFRDKLSFVLLSGEHVYLYYYIGAFLRKTKSCFRKIACAQNRNVQKEMR